MITTLPENVHTKILFRTITYTIKSNQNLFQFFAHFSKLLIPGPAFIEWAIARMWQYNRRPTTPISVRTALLISISIATCILFTKNLFEICMDFIILVHFILSLSLLSQLPSGRPALPLSGIMPA